MASLSEAFTNLSKTFAKPGINLTWNGMLGLIIQSNLKEPLRQPVNQKVDLYMEAHNYKIPSAQDMLRFVDAARTRIQLTDASKKGEMNSLCVSLGISPHHGEATTDDPPSVDI